MLNQNLIRSLFILAAIFVTFATFNLWQENAVNAQIVNANQEQKGLKDAFPKLSGQKAIKHLKEKGFYSSFVQSISQESDEPLGPEMRRKSALLGSFGEVTKLTAIEGQAEDEFGFSVSISGNTAVIGAPGSKVGVNFVQGAVYIFVRNGTTWVRQAKLTASDGAEADLFGSSVSLDGNTVAVGARYDDIGTNFNQGSVYIFVRNGDAWTEQTKIVAADGTSSDEFGASVGVSGNTVIVGARFADSGDQFISGAAYIFIRNGTIWNLQAKLVDGNTENDQFGCSVSISSDTAIIGSRFDRVGANSGQGSAYVFVRNGLNWTQEAKLTAADGSAGDRFGASVGLSGNTAIVGSVGNSGFGLFPLGAAYVYVRSGTNWTQQAKLSRSDAEPNEAFGNSVGISGDIAVVGTIGDKIGENNSQGAVYVFERNNGMWIERSKLVASDGEANDFFGSSVSVSDETVITSSLGDDVGANINQGAAYIFTNLSKAPDLQSISDTGDSNSDNVTNSRHLYFDIYDVTSGATVQLFRNNELIASSLVSGTSVTVSDENPPANGVFRYDVLQVLNNQIISQSAVLTVTIDTISPSVIVNQANDQLDPTRFQPLRYSALFSEPVTGFNNSDVSLVGSTADVSAANIAISGNSNLYSILVSNIISNGQQIRASIVAGAAMDLAGNNSVSSTSTDNIISLDNVAPTVVINQAQNQIDPTRTLPINFTVVFSEPVTEFNNFDLSFAGSTAPVSFPNLSITGSGTTYNVSVSGFNSNNQVVRLSVVAGGAQDAAGNGNMASTSIDNTITVDNVAPTVTLNQAAVTLSQRPGPQPDPATILPVEFTVIFSEPVSGFDASDISLAGSTADVSRASVVIVANGSNYNVVVSNIATAGQIRASVLAGAVSDSLGNTNAASTSTDNSITYNPAYITVRGRVSLASGRGASNAQLVLILPNGEQRYARTNSFGYYRFDNIQTSNISITITSKNSVGAGLAFFLWEDTPDINITLQLR